MAKKHKILTGVFVIFFLFLATAPYAAQALEVNYPAIPTPAGSFDLDQEFSEGTITLSGLIFFIYALAVWLGGIFAFVLLVYLGFAYILGGAAPAARKQAKRWLNNVLWGLLILLFAVVIFDTINPNILELESNELLTFEFDVPTYEAPSIQLQDFIVGGEGSTSTFSCTYVDPPEGDTSSFLCRYTSDGKCVPDGGDACEAGYAEEKCSVYDGGGSAVCNGAPRQECPADPNAEGGCVPVGGDNCEPGYAEDLCSSYNDRENAQLLCESVSQAACPADTGGGEGGEIFCYEQCVEDSGSPGPCQGLPPCPDIACPTSETSELWQGSYCYDRTHERHNGHDIYDDDKTEPPLYAMEAGTLDKVGVTSGGTCRLWIKNTASGLYYTYLHLGTDSINCSDAFAPGIETGVDVVAGELLGYMGITNANGAQHLHITISKPSGTEECSPPPLSGNYENRPSTDGWPLFEEAGCPFTQ